MENKQYLTFRLHNLQYGMEAGLVQEILPMPVLTTVTEAPTDVLGIINFRGQIVPVLSINCSQNHNLPHCNSGDYVIVILWEGLQIGILAHQVNEMLELDSQVIEREPSYEIIADVNSQLISGIAKLESGIIVLLKSELLVPQPDTLLTFIWDMQSQIEFIAEELASEGHKLEAKISEKNLLNHLFYENLNLEESAIFEINDDKNSQFFTDKYKLNKLISLAVISFNNQLFGVEMELVREFVNLGNFTHVPCCPKHIVGNMNLRGEIVTLVDIREFINLPLTPIGIGSKVIVTEVEDIIAGLLVDEVLELVYLKTSEIDRSNLCDSIDSQQYVQGTSIFNGKILHILDLSKIFSNDKLLLAEEF
ncbi:MAG: chemotaxis protein CheW [Nostocaceae cyanobacterium]|nr:chemotaxis protein CheW [Nostocaceae cyanobacterium]